MASISIIQTLSPYSGLIYPGVMALYFLMAGGAVLRPSRLRKPFVFLLVLGVTVSGLTSIQVSPFTNLNRYTDVVEKTHNYTTVRLVDTEGKEIRIDSRALLGYSYSTFPVFYPETNNSRYGSILIRKARKLREEIDSGGSHHPGYFPPPYRGFRWSEEMLEGYSRFQSIKFYRTRIKFEPEGHRVKDKTILKTTEFTR